MFLVNWFEANAMMIAMTVVLVGLPIVLLIYAFGRRPGNQDNEEE